jgi:uncharacterized protein YjiS (DUF1127 family)
MAYTTIITENTSFPAFNLSTPVTFISKSIATAKQRRALARLTETQLNDIGITTQQRATECSRRFWQHN